MELRRTIVLQPFPHIVMRTIYLTGTMVHFAHSASNDEELDAEGMAIIVEGNSIKSIQNSLTLADVYSIRRT